MRRLLMAAAAALPVFFFHGAASAQDRPRLAPTATLKAATESGKSQTFVYVEGDALFPDGTSLTVGIRHPSRDAWIKVIGVVAKHGRFMAEIGPMDRRFPPGLYRIVVEFRFDSQPAALKESLQADRDIEKCVLTDREFRERYGRENPKALAVLLERAKTTGGCPGKDQIAGCDLRVGTPDEAEAAQATEAAFLAGTADTAAELLTRLARADAAAGGIDAQDPSDWFDAWRAEWEAASAAFEGQWHTLLCSPRESVWEALDSVFQNLELLQESVHSEMVGQAGERRRALAELEALGDGATREDRRRLSRLRKEAGEEAERRARLEQSIAGGIEAALYGPHGISPSEPVRLQRLRALRDACGFTWEVR